MSKTVQVQLLHSASVPGARWCSPIGWVPGNEIIGSVYEDGSWWDDSEETAGLIVLRAASEYGWGDKAEVDVNDLRVASCGDVQIVQPVVLPTKGE